MKDGKIKDLLSATKEETVDIVVSEALPEAVETILGEIVPEASAAIFGGILGTVAPGINGIRMGYKQKRLERNVSSAIAVMTKRIDVLEARVSDLNAEMKNRFEGPYLEWLLDVMLDEREEGKIPHYMNGYINLISNDVNDNLVLMFIDTISELTMLDIEVLQLYSLDAQENVVELCNRYNLSYEQLAVVKRKLNRLGLLEDRNDMIRDSNIDELAKYMQSIKKNNNSKIPKMSKVTRTTRYQMTALGKNYLQIISE